MAKGKPREESKEVFWRKTMEQHQQSGLSIREFCRREKLREPSFYSWRRELARRDAIHRSSTPDRRKTVFIPVRLATEAQPAPPNPSGRIEIELPGRRRVHVAPPINRQALADVLAVLLQAPSGVEGEARPC